MVSSPGPCGDRPPRGVLGGAGATATDSAFRSHSNQDQWGDGALCPQCWGWTATAGWVVREAPGEPRHKGLLPVKSGTEHSRPRAASAQPGPEAGEGRQSRAWSPEPSRPRRTQSPLSVGERVAGRGGPQAQKATSVRNPPAPPRMAPAVSPSYRATHAGDCSTDRGANCPRSHTNSTQAQATGAGQGPWRQTGQTEVWWQNRGAPALRTSTHACRGSAWRAHSHPPVPAPGPRPPGTSPRVP